MPESIRILRWEALVALNEARICKAPRACSLNQPHARDVFLHARL